MAHASVGKGKQNHTKPRYSLGNSRALCNGISPINPTRPSQLVLYGLPALVIGYMFILLQVYVLKYATDVLLIAPAVVGAIFGLARIWDAVTDPVIGYLSDRTQSRMGRRRIWLAGSIFPAAGFYIMLYASPVGLSPGSAAVWMGVAVFGFYTAMTAITVPHYSLGAEVTKDSYMRNKLFGMRHAMIGAGAILALLTLRWLTSFDPADIHSLRAASLTSASVASAIGVVGVLATAVFFREPAYSAATNIPASGIYAASKSILKNPRARLLLIVQFIESIGSGALTAAALYVAQYVLGNIGIAPLAIVCYLATATVSIPLWVRVSKSVPKVELWIITMAGSAVSYGGLFFLVFLDRGALQTALLIALCLLSGAMSGCANTMGPSVLSDVIDDDDLQTGTRKEGAHFAWFNLAQKSAQGITVMITGIVLTLVGFTPNVEQDFNTQLALCGILGLLPFICYATGTLLFMRFDLRAEAHAKIVAALELRSNAG